MKQLWSKYAKIIASTFIEKTGSTVKKIDRQKNGQKGRNKSCSEYMILWGKNKFWKSKIRDNLGTDPLLVLLLILWFYYLFISDCWHIRKNNFHKEFETWGDVFNIELGIKVTKLPVATWTNVFHFSANGDNEKYGDRIPALYIHKSGYFQVCSAVNDTSYCKSINFEPAKHYQMAIIQ